MVKNPVSLIGTALIFIGLLIAFFSHFEAFMFTSASNMYEHFIHIFGGMSLALIGIIILVYKQNGTNMKGSKYYTSVQKAVISE